MRLHPALLELLQSPPDQAADGGIECMLRYTDVLTVLQHSLERMLDALVSLRGRAIVAGTRVGSLHTP